MFGGEEKYSYISVKGMEVGKGMSKKLLMTFGPKL